MKVRLQILIDERGCSAELRIKGREHGQAWAENGTFLALSRRAGTAMKWEFEDAQGAHMQELCEEIVKVLDVTTRGTISGEAVFWANLWLGKCEYKKN